MGLRVDLIDSLLRDLSLLSCALVSVSTDVLQQLAELNKKLGGTSRELAQALQLLDTESPRTEQLVQIKDSSKTLAALEHQLELRLSRLGSLSTKILNDSESYRCVGRAKQEKRQQEQLLNRIKLFCKDLWYEKRQVLSQLEKVEHDLLGIAGSCRSLLQLRKEYKLKQDSEDCVCHFACELLGAAKSIHTTVSQFELVLMEFLYQLGHDLRSQLAYEVELVELIEKIDAATRFELSLKMNSLWRH